MFAQVFSSHPAEPLEDSKCHSPQLDVEELEALVRLFIQDRKIGRADARKWKRNSTLSLEHLTNPVER